MAGAGSKYIHHSVKDKSELSVYFRWGWESAGGSHDPLAIRISKQHPLGKALWSEWSIWEKTERYLNLLYLPMESYDLFRCGDPRMRYNCRYCKVEHDTLESRLRCKCGADLDGSIRLADAQYQEEQKDLCADRLRSRK
jgi:hypothetical protein